MSRSQRFDWFSINSRRKRRPSSAGEFRRRLRAEALEDRRVLAVDASIVTSPGELLEREIDLGFGDVLQLDGVDDHVSIPSSAANNYQPGIEFTVEAWVRVDPEQLDTATGENSIIEKKTGPNGKHPFAIRYSPATGQISVSQSDGFDTPTVTSSINVNDGAYHHIAMVKGVSSITLYVDGQFQGNINGISLFTTGNNSPLFFGHQGGGANNFRGEIDEVRIWNTARSLPQIQQNMMTPLTGNEPQLVSYYKFDNGTADDSAANNDGALQNGVGFTEYADPSVIGFAEIRLSAPVAVEPGIIVNYTLGGTATQGVDYYSSQLDLVTVDDSFPVENSVYIPKGADSATIAFAALPDAIDEFNETITVSLAPDNDPFGTGPNNYTIAGGSLSPTITLVDSGLFSAGLSLTNVFGENAVSEGLHFDANGQTELRVKLDSQPEATVFVNVLNSTGAALSGPPLVFTPQNWDTKQSVTLSGAAGNGDKIEDLLGALSFSTSTSDSAYLGVSANVSVLDESATTKVKVEEGGPEQPITPTISVTSTGTVVEGSDQDGVLIFASDVAAPPGGLTIRYTLVDASGLGADFTLIDSGEAAPGVRSAVIPEGQLTATVLVVRGDDAIASGDFTVAVDIAANSAYQVGDASSAAVTLEDDDFVGIETATLIQRNGVDIPKPFDSTSLIATTEGGDDFTFGVRLNSQPMTPVTVTIASSNSGEGQAAAALVFDSETWNVFQLATVTPQDDAILDGDVPFTVLVSASGDADYSGVRADFTITNEDNESREDSDVSVDDTAPIIATLSPVVEVGVEGGIQPQFEIQLSAPAPAGGLTVAYNIFERSATAADLNLPRLVEQLGDRNPLALTQVPLPDNSFEQPYSLVFGDIDNDGDQDALLSIEASVPQLFENTGTPEVPDFVENTSANPLQQVGRGSALSDVDADGDLDVVQISADGTALLYFESQLIDSGSMSFIERTGMDSAFGGLALVNGYSPALADLDNDGTPELFVSRSSGLTSDYFAVNGSGDYVAAGPNPLSGAVEDNFTSFSFADVDLDGDLDVFVAGFDMRYLENVGSPIAPEFVERTGVRNPAANIFNDGSSMSAGAVDIDNDDDIDLFVANRRSIGEVESVFEVRYFDSPELQEVVVPEGQTSLVVSIPVVDDVIDESTENFEVGLVSQQTATYDLVTSADFDDAYQLEIVEVAPGSIGVNLVNASLTNINFLELLAGEVLDFDNGQVTVTQDTLIDDNTLSINVPVSFDSGTVSPGDIATSTFDDTVTLFVPGGGGLFGGELDLRIQGNETTSTVLLEAGTQLNFSGGATVEITQTTLVTAFERTFVPAMVIGAGSVGSNETADFSAPIGELNLVVDEPGIDFYALEAGRKLSLSDGSVFIVTEPAVVGSAAGDYNGSGVVDIADYTVWRDTLGSTTDLAADGDENGSVDQADYDLWVENFGVESGVAVTGYYSSLAAPTVSATTTVTEAGYRTTVGLVVISGYDPVSSTVSLQIDDPGFSGFTIPAGSILQFSGGAVVAINDAVGLSNSAGTSVAVTPIGDPSSTTIAVGETSATADFSSSVTLVTAFQGSDDGFIEVNILEAGVTSVELTAGTLLSFTQSGAVVVVANTVTVIDSEEGATLVEVFLDESSLVEGIGEIQVGDTASLGGENSVSSLGFTIEDNDEAGVNLNLSGTTTSEAGDSETIGVMLTTEPTENVVVVLAVDGDEAVLSDADEANQKFVQLLFTPTSWDTPQTVTVTGINDDVDDGASQYTLRTTALSADAEYADDVVEVVFPFDVSDSMFASLQIDDIGILDAVLPQNTQLKFENGAVLQADLDEDVLLKNSSATLVEYSVIESVDRIPAGETATAVDFPTNNDDFRPTSKSLAPTTACWASSG